MWIGSWLSGWLGRWLGYTESQPPVVEEDYGRDVVLVPAYDTSMYVALGYTALRVPADELAEVAGEDVALEAQADALSALVAAGWWAVAPLEATTVGVSSEVSVGRVGYAAQISVPADFLSVLVPQDAGIDGPGSTDPLSLGYDTATTLGEDATEVVA